MNLKIEELKLKLKTILKKDNERSQKVFINTIISFFIKGGSILVGLLLVPMTIDFINPVQYGIWLTISSIVSWMSFFDIGMGNGLRNNLAGCLAFNKFEEAKIYISTTYIILSVIGMILFIIFSLVNPFIDWERLLNIPSVMTDIHTVFLLVFSSFCIQFVVQLINIILLAIHESAKSALIAFIGQLLILGVIFILKKNTIGNLKVLVLVLTGIPVVILICSNLFFFQTKLKKISPSFRFFRFYYTKKVLNIGSLFFVIQIGAIVLFQTDNIIITRLLGPSSVTQFNVYHKIFSVITMVFSILVTPYWSAFTDAFAKDDLNWIKNSVKKIRFIAFSLSIISIFLCVFFKYILLFWIGNILKFDLKLSLSMTIYVIVLMWQTTNVYMLNGIGKIKLQLILVTISAVINIPLAAWTAIHWGLPGVISANTILFVIMGIIFNIQVNKILKKEANGIWNT